MKKKSLALTYLIHVDREQGLPTKLHAIFTGDAEREDCGSFRAEWVMHLTNYGQVEEFEVPRKAAKYLR